MRYPDEHLDEGTIHAWLDDALAPDESRIIEAHVQTCERCSAAVAEARGLMAASSRILSALDDMPAGVIPDSTGGAGGSRDQLAALRARRAAEQATARRRWWRRSQFVAAASVAFVALGTTAVMWRGSFRADALPEAPVARLEADRAVASDSVVPLPSPAPEARSGAAVAPVEARRESKVASAPAGTDSAAGGSRDSASARVGKSLLSEVVPTGVAQRAVEAAPPAESTRLRRQAGAAAPPQQGLAEQQRPQVSQQVRLQAEDRMLQRSRAAAAQANEAPVPAAAPALPRIDSAAFARPTADLGALAPADAGCYELSMVATDEALAAVLPSGVRLDTARVRVVGDTVWRRAVSLTPGTARELEWRRVDAASVELAWSDDASGARFVRRLGLTSIAGTALGVRAATEVGALPADAATDGVRAVRVGCPR